MPLPLALEILGDPGSALVIGDVVDNHYSLVNELQIIDA